MDFTLKMRLLEGFGEMPFGMSYETFVKNLGNPTHEEELEGMEITEEVKMLMYEDIKTSFFFENENGTYYFKSCDVEHEDLMLFDVKVFDLEEEELIKLFADRDFSEHEVEHEEWGQKRISFPEMLCDFYFADGKLESVTWGINYITEN